VSSLFATKPDNLIRQGKRENLCFKARFGRASRSAPELSKRKGISQLALKPAQPYAYDLRLLMKAKTAVGFIAIP
jgi:hypothetical protein